MRGTIWTNAAELGGTLLAVMLITLMQPVAGAQDAPPPGPGTPPPAFGAAAPPATPPVSPSPANAPQEEAVAADVAPVEEAPEKPVGDVVTLKNGKVLSGVQVSRESPLVIEVQVVPGVEPLVIPRKQVADIVYDNFAASDIKEGTPGGGNAPPPGRRKGETSIELAQKLGKYVAEEALVIEQRDVIEVITELAEKVEAELEVTPEVQQLPKLDREWTVTIPVETSLITVLRDLPRDFPQLDAEILADRVRLRLKPAS